MLVAVVALMAVTGMLVVGAVVVPSVDVVPAAPVLWLGVLLSHTPSLQPRSGRGVSAAVLYSAGQVCATIGHPVPCRDGVTVLHRQTDAAAHGRLQRRAKSV